MKKNRLKLKDVQGGSVMVRIGVILIFAILSASLVSCRWGFEGELKRGNFFYDCVDMHSDWNCGGILGSSFGSRSMLSVVIGGSFDLWFQSEDGRHYRVVQASDEHVRTVVPGEYFRFERPGPVGFLAIDKNMRVHDLFHMYGIEPAYFKFTYGFEEENLSPQGTLELQVEEAIFILAGPMSRNDNVLSGSLKYSWSCADEGIASISPYGNLVWIHGVSTGATILNLEVLGDSYQFNIIVTGDSDGGGDSDSDTDDGMETEADDDGDTDAVASELAEGAA